MGAFDTEQVLCLRQEYELLRAEALDINRPARGQGLMTLLGRGMAGWIQSFLAPQVRTQTLALTPLAVDFDCDWVVTLATLVMGTGVRHD